MLSTLIPPLAKPKSTVHSSHIAHVDEAKKLLWLNGSLLREKGSGGTRGLMDYFVPDTWMIGGTWSWTPRGEFTAYMQIKPSGALANRKGNHREDCTGCEGGG
jgi:hypothetical protein